MKRSPMTPVRALQYARQRITKCVLCGAQPVDRIGAFLPHHPERYVGPPVREAHQQRAWFYGVCAGCAILGLNAVAERVERLLAAPLN